MSYFIPFQTPAHEAGAPVQGLRKAIAPSQALAGVLSAALLAALMVVADQLIDSWVEGHLLLAWVMLWAAIFTVLALLAWPLRRASVAAALWLQTRVAAWNQARRDTQLWDMACQDPRLLQELRAALARSGQA